MAESGRLDGNGIGVKGLGLMGWVWNKEELELLLVDSGCLGWVSVLLVGSGCLVGFKNRLDLLAGSVCLFEAWFRFRSTFNLLDGSVCLV